MIHPSYIFYILAFLSILFALLVIFSENPIHSCLYLVLTMFCIAANYFLMNAQFLGIVQLIVYAGAIMVLFLFTIMLLNLNKESEPTTSIIKKVIGVLGGGTLLLIFTFYLIKSTDPLQMPMILPNNNQIGLIQNLGKSLFTDYVFPFEVISILILTAMVGAVIIGKKDKAMEISSTTEND
jgi:NADH-quinone oxidoreductase subunit J